MVLQTYLLAYIILFTSITGCSTTLLNLLEVNFLRLAALLHELLPLQDVPVDLAHLLVYQLGWLSLVYAIVLRLLVIELGQS